MRFSTFGVYQTFYESGQLWTETSSNISWIGSVQSVMLLVFGAVAGPIYDRGYLRSLLIVGSFLVVFGHMMLSLTHSFWEAVLAQGFVIGIGGACLCTFDPHHATKSADRSYLNSRSRGRYYANVF